MAEDMQRQEQQTNKRKEEATETHQDVWMIA
jgi:hypothetical protein